MEEKEGHLPEENKQQPMWKVVARAAWRWTKRLVMAVLFLFFSVVLLLQIPPVQNWIAQKVTGALSRTLETTEAELMETVFPHPTLSEMMHEAVLDAYARALHI